MRAASTARVPFLRVVKGKGGYLFLLCVLLVFFQAGLFAGHRSHPFWSSQLISSSLHPIPRLMDEAEHRYQEKLRNQSRTLPDAVREYHRRYARDPPRGFDAWWQFAEDNAVIMRDEYDAIFDDLSPFWLLTPAEVRHRAVQAGHLPSINLVRVREGNASIVNLRPDFIDSEKGARAQGFVAMLEKFVHMLPDMDFPINAKAEGRVLVPWEHTAYPNFTSPSDSSTGVGAILSGLFHADWADDGNVWDAWRRTCPPDSPARRAFSAFRNHSAGEAVDYLTPSSPSSMSSSSLQQQQQEQPDAEPRFSFVSNTAASTLDFCQQPHFRFSQGHFFSDWRTLSALFPVFSPAKARGFGDVRVPSHYYYASNPRYTYGWDEANLEEREWDRGEVRWEEKQPRVFWRGATTGGGSHPPGWVEGYQRHRFVRMVSSNSSAPKLVTFPRPKTDYSPAPSYVTLPVSQGTLNEETMDAAFVAMLPSSEPSSPLFPSQTSLQQAHRFADAVPLGEHWRYKYLADLDGMGYSGRFLAFLASGSVPLKATVYEEWWAGRLEPWLHFIPLSTTYDEIYDIYAYFSGPTNGMLDAWQRAEAVVSNSSSSLDGAESSSASSGKGKEEIDSAAIPHAQANERPSISSYSASGLPKGDDRRLRRIARAGQQWKRTVGRRVDMEAYVFRLALEWARVVADDREEMVFRI